MKMKLESPLQTQRVVHWPYPRQANPYGVAGLNGKRWIWRQIYIIEAITQEQADPLGVAADHHGFEPLSFPGFKIA